MEFLKQKKGQEVFFAAFFALAALIIFFLTLPTMLSFISTMVSGSTNKFANLMVLVIPAFMFIMIIWTTIAIARSE